LEQQCKEKENALRSDAKSCVLYNHAINQVMVNQNSMNELNRTST